MDADWYVVRQQYCDYPNHYLAKPFDFS